MVGHNNRLGNESIPKLLWKMSVPAVLGMLINALYNIVDTISLLVVLEHLALQV